MKYLLTLLICGFIAGCNPDGCNAGLSFGFPSTVNVDSFGCSGSFNTQRLEVNTDFQYTR